MEPIVHNLNIPAILTQIITAVSVIYPNVTNPTITNKYMHVSIIGKPDPNYFYVSWSTNINIVPGEVHAIMYTINAY